MPDQIAELRKQLQALELDGFIVPRFDAHQGEYIAPHDERLHYLTNFSGSAGMAIVTHETVAMFVDGRYSVQVKEECIGDHFSYHHLFDAPPEDWLAQQFEQGARIGFDAMHLPPVWFDRFVTALSARGIRMQAVEDNPVDVIWRDQPAKPMGQVSAMPVQFAGQSAADKIAGTIAAMKHQGVNFHIETQPDNIAWLLNVRGNDVAFLPAPQSFLMIEQAGAVHWFIELQKLGNDIREGLPGAVQCQDAGAFLPHISQVVDAGQRVSLDPDFSPVAVRAVLESAGADILAQRSPLTIAKAQKNPTEREGMRACHIHDGVAVTELSAWLIEQVPIRAAAGQPIDEREAEDKVQEFRRAHSAFLGESFNTISAAGGNAAMCHYATTAKRNAPILPNAPYLLDSGGQYETGTTDVTRSFTFGTLPDGYAQAYTAVFKALYALSSLKFPKGTQGHHIDAICRRPLWDLGLDYDHGTGHGIGHRLSVHEHPHRIGKQISSVDLKPGMILSIEPGYYLADAFGIRIENLFEIVELDNGFMRFENLTWVPILVDALISEALSTEERAFLTAYHQNVIDTLGPLLSSRALAWCRSNAL